MVKIGPVEYDKEEENILGRSFLLGVLIGFPLGIFANYLVGFPKISGQPPDGFLGWTSLFFVLIMRFLIMPCILTMIIVVLFWRKEKKLNTRHFIRTLWSILIFFLILPLYAIITYSALDALLGGTLATTSYVLFTLLVTPFVALFLAVFLPESRIGKALRRCIRRSWRSGKMEHE